MQIEIRVPQGQVKEWLISFVKNELFKLHCLDKEISRAEVHLKAQGPLADSEKICTATLTIYGNTIFVKRAAESYDRAIRDVLKELQDRINERVKKQNEPPDERVSTVKV